MGWQDDPVESQSAGGWQNDPVADDAPAEPQSIAGRMMRATPMGLFSDVAANPKWAEVPMQALKNAPGSVANLAKGVYETVRHPLDTAGNLIDVAAGGLQNILPESLVSAVNKIDPNAQAAEEARTKASAVGQFYKNRYGSEEGFRQAIAQDPAGVLADAATVLTGGGGLLRKAGQVSNISGLERAGQVAGRAGVAIDPLANAVSVGGKVMDSAGRGVANVIGSLGTHTGGQTIQNAFRAGAKGGDTASDFAANLRGTAPMTDVLDQAKSALSNIYDNRSAAYKSGMANVRGDKTVLDLTPIKAELVATKNIGTFKGKIVNNDAVNVHQQITSLIDDWNASSPNAYHTPEGLDALKPGIGSIREATGPRTPARVVADKMYNTVKNQIVAQAPTYAKTMKDYETASKLVKEIERAFSMGEKASIDTAMRKLQSLTRNNVSTNYGNRVNLAKELEAAGAGNLMTNLSGQALSSWTPRGLGGLVAGGSVVGGTLAGNPAVIPLIAAQSPRLMGELSYGAGRLKGLVDKGVGGVTGGLRGGGIDPAILANYLYQMQQPKEQ